MSPIEIDEQHDCGRPCLKDSGHAQVPKDFSQFLSPLSGSCWMTGPNFATRKWADPRALGTDPEPVGLDPPGWC